MLSVAEAAQLRGCSERNIKAQCKNGTIESKKTINEKNRPKYLIPLDAMPADAQRRYHSKHAPKLPISIEAAVLQSEFSKAVDEFSADEREDIDFWITLLERWEYYRNRADDIHKADIDDRFIAQCRLEHPNRPMSINILYRHSRALRNNDMEGLLDKRGKSRAGECSIPDEIVSAFFTTYLTQSKLSVPRCMKAVEQWAKKELPSALPLPCYSTFYRKAMELPLPVRVLCREGDKAYYDKCSPYTRRKYDTLGANDWWVGDTYTCDVMVRDAAGKEYRPYLSAWVDVRSGIFVGWNIAFDSNSQNTVYALSKAARKYGVPNNNFYIDNGREYLTYDLGGRGHRAKKVLANGSEAFAPPGIFQRMEVGMVNAIVCNARAKICERSFLDVKNAIMKLFPTYTGGSVKEKPERLKHVLKTEGVPTPEEFIEKVDKLIEGYLNYEPYYGEVAEDKGQRRIDVYFKRRLKTRQPTEEALRLMLLRTSKPVTVKRIGIEIDVRGGAKAVFYHEMLCNQMLGEKVYARYDPDDLTSVRVYDEEDRFLMEVPRSDLVANYGDTQEVISANEKKKRHAKKALTEFINTLVMQDGEIDPLALMLDLAQENLANPAKDYTSKLVKLEYPQETPLLQAVGDVNVSLINRNFILQNGGIDDE